MKRMKAGLRFFPQTIKVIKVLPRESVDFDFFLFCRCLFFLFLQCFNFCIDQGTQSKQHFLAGIEKMMERFFWEKEGKQLFWNRDSYLSCFRFAHRLTSFPEENEIISNDLLAKAYFQYFLIKLCFFNRVVEKGLRKKYISFVMSNLDEEFFSLLEKV